MSVLLSVSPSVFLSVRPSIRLSVCLSVSLSVCLSVCLSVRLSACLSICLFVCLSVHSFVCLSVCLSVVRLLVMSALLFVCLLVNLSNSQHIILYVYFSGCLPACLIVCLFACLCVLVRKYPTMREPIILAHIPGTNRTFLFMDSLVALAASCFAAFRLPTDHQRILTCASNIPFNVLRSMNDILFCKAKHVPTVYSDKKPQLLIPLKKIPLYIILYQEEMRFQRCNLF